MHVPATLAECTTLRVGGPAASWIRAESEDEIVEAVRECDSVGSDVLLLGDGSNLVVADSGFDGTVVEIASRGVTTSQRDDVVTMTVAAGEPWDEIVAGAVSQGLSGLEAMSGIPGRCGATPVQNVGAYGQDVSQVISSVDAFDRQREEIVTLSRRECGFGYRTSAFKERETGWVVLSVTFELRVSTVGPVRYAELAKALGVEVGANAALDDIRAAVIALRRRKGMVLDPLDHDTWSAGSFFTNPIVPADHPAPSECPRYPAVDGIKLSAAWLIEHAGVERGYSIGSVDGAAISSKHTLALCNRGSATASDVIALARDVRGRVVDAFGIDLAIEPRLVGIAAS